MTLSSDQDEQQFQPEGDVSSSVTADESNIVLPPEIVMEVEKLEVAAAVPTVDIEDLTLAEAFAQVVAFASRHFTVFAPGR